MEKKNYQTPTCLVVELKHKARLMSGSDTSFSPTKEAVREDLSEENNKDPFSFE